MDARFLYSLPIGFPGVSRLFSLVKHDDYLDQVRDLLSKGDDPNSRSRIGDSLLIEAVNSYYETDCIVLELIKAGADVNSCTINGLTALHFAVLHGKRRVFEELVKSGASINAKDHFGKTILHYAVIRYPYPLDECYHQFDPWFADELLKHEDIDINAVDSDGNTPLMIAVLCRRPNEVLKLLRNKANPNISNNLSETPLHKAFAIAGHPSTYSLLHYDADIYSEDNNGQTPIDVFIKHMKDSRLELSIIFKELILKYNITEELKLKLAVIANLTDLVNKCYDEVDQMKKDFICGNYTLYDFLRNRINANEFENTLLQIHVPLMKKLVKFDYSQYLCDIIRHIKPESNIYTILEMMAFERKNAEGKKGKDLSDLLSITEINHLICGYLFYLDTFCLIAAFSNERIVKYQNDMHRCYPIFYNDM